MGASQSRYEADAGVVSDQKPPKRSRGLPFCSEVNAGLFETPHLDLCTDVWLLAGDGLAVGMNANDCQELPKTCQPLPGLILTFNVERNVWEDAAPQTIVQGSATAAPRVSVGPEIAFARKLLELGLSESVGIVPVTAPGSSLESDWSPKTGRLNSALLQRTRDAMRALPHGRMRGILWIHGEGDGGDPKALGRPSISAISASSSATAALVPPVTTTDSLACPPGVAAVTDGYLEALKDFIDSLRYQLSSLHPMLPVVLGVVPNRVYPKMTYMSEIRRCQQLLFMPGVVHVDMDGFETCADGRGHVPYLSKSGQAAFGATAALAYFASVRALPRLHPGSSEPATANLLSPEKTQGHIDV